MLFGITATDPVTLAAVIVVLMAVAGAASTLPTLRAIKVVRPSLSGMSNSQSLCVFHPGNAVAS